jgi:hypothetical protein
MPWIITKDYIADPTAPKGTNANAVGIVGPRSAKLTAEQILNHPQGKRFRMRDDDGELYYEGIMVVTPEDGDEAELRPLDDFGTPNAGATSIEYRQPDGSWQMV